MSDNIAVRVKEFSVALAQNMKAVASVLPPGMDAGRFCRVAVNAILKNPALAECDKNSFVMSVINCAEMGLEPSLGQAALIPYKKKVTCQPMYQGLIQLCRNSGELKSLSVEVVLKGEEFVYSLGLEPELKHMPDPNKDRNKEADLEYVYAIGHLMNGTSQFVVLNRKQVEERKKVSPGHHHAESPWQKWPGEQWKKTALKALTKLLPKSTQLQRAVTLDDLSQTGKAQAPELADLTETTIDVEAVHDQTQDAGLRKPKRKSEPQQNNAEPDKPKELSRDEMLSKVQDFADNGPQGPFKRAIEEIGKDINIPLDELEDSELQDLWHLLKAV